MKKAMNSRTFKRAGLGLGLAMTAALALCVFASVGTAAAATQHWAGASQVPYGSSQEFSGEATGGFLVKWAYGGGGEVKIECNSLSTSGTVENPAGDGVATLESDSFQLGNCLLVNKPFDCAIEGDSISLSPMSGEAVEESGEDLIAYGGDAYGELNIVKRPTKSCFFEGSYPIRAQITAASVQETPGEYVIDDNSLLIGGRSAQMSGRYDLSTPSEEALVLSSEASPGTPHWYLGSDEWSTLTAGESGAFSTNDGMSFELDSEVWGASLEFTCDSGETDIEGSLENPSGGGAGTAGADASFGGCVMPGKLGEKCEVLPFESGELSGIATEVGGSPAVELAPAEGSEIATFTIVTKEGASKECVLAGEYHLRGALIATSGEDGHFDLSGDELTLQGIFPASAGGGFVLEDGAAQTLRIQS